MVYEDDRVLCFHDRAPAADVHLLVIPKMHHPSAAELKGGDVELAEYLAATGQRCIAELCGEKAAADDALYGYHWPPFSSVKHLHLHALAPASSMSFRKRLVYKAGSPWFATSDWLLERLRGMRAAAAAAPTSTS